MSEYVVRATGLPASFAPRLATLDVELTERCDNNCLHCCINLPANDPDAQRRELTTTEWKEMFKQAADLGCLQVRITGGEPLLRPDFEDLYICARQLGMKVLLFTNGRVLGTTRGAHIVDTLVHLPPRVPIEITVYGMHAASYEAVSRVPGSHTQFRRGVDRLLSGNVPFVVKSALLPPNRSEMDEFESWATALPWQNNAPGYAMFFDLRHRRDDPERNRLIASLRIAPEDGVAVLMRHERQYREAMHEFGVRFLGPPGDLLFACGAGHALTVDAYGCAQPCLGLRSPELTIDLKSHSLDEALRAYESLRGMRASNPEYLRRCARCFLKSLCEQCPARAWTEHGTLDTPVDYLCAVAHAKARALGWLAPDEVGYTCGTWRSKVIDEPARASEGQASGCPTSPTETPPCREQ